MWYYLHRNPLTDGIVALGVVLTWNEATGDWDLPEDQPTLPHMVEGSDFYETPEEALSARRAFVE